MRVRGDGGGMQAWKRVSLWGVEKVTGQNGGRAGSGRRLVKGILSIM